MTRPPASQDRVADTFGAGQDAWLDAVHTWTDSMKSMMSSLGPKGPAGAPDTDRIVDNVFAFAEQMLAAQKQFTKNLLSAGGPALSAARQAVEQVTQGTQRATEKVTGAAQRTAADASHAARQGTEDAAHTSEDVAAKVEHAAADAEAAAKHSGRSADEPLRSVQETADEPKAPGTRGNRKNP